MLNLHKTDAYLLKSTLKSKLTVKTLFLCIKYRIYLPILIFEVQISKQMHFTLIRRLSVSICRAYRQINARSVNLPCEQTNKCTSLTKVKVGSANRQINVRQFAVQITSTYNINEVKLRFWVNCDHSSGNGNSFHSIPQSRKRPTGD